MGTQDEHQNLMYSPSRWTKRFTNPDNVIDDFIRSSREASEESRRSVLHELDVVYGPRSNQRVDFFGEKSLPKGAPVFFFVHGGFWVEGCRQYSCTMAKCFHQAGIVIAILGYDLAPAVSLSEIVNEIEDGVKFVTEWARDRDARLWLCGHSAGAHLIAMVLSRLQTMYSNISGAILISGVYHLEPLLSTYVAVDAALDRDTCAKNSPLRLTTELAQNVSSSDMVFLLAIAENDPPAFKQQTEDYHQALRDNNLKSDLLVVPDTDHFDIITNLQFPHFILTNKIINLILGK